MESNVLKYSKTVVGSLYYIRKYHMYSKKPNSSNLTDEHRISPIFSRFSNLVYFSIKTDVNKTYLGYYLGC